MVGDKKSPEVDSDPRNAPPIEAGPVESHQSAEGTSDVGSTQTPTPKFGGMKVDPRKGATTLWGAFGKAASPILDKAAQLGRFPGGFSTATRFLQELVKLSTESEKTHGIMYIEAHAISVSPIQCSEWHG